MSGEEPTEEAPPRTRTCRVCSVEINAASARCPYCGTRQFKHQPILGWRGLLVCLAAVAAAVLVTRAVVTSGGGPQAFDAYTSVNLSAFFPSAWQNQLLSAPHGTAVVAYANPSHPVDGEKISATVSAPGTPRSRILALTARLRVEPGVLVGYTGPERLRFPGGQAVWTVLYNIDKINYEVFAFEACSGTIGVTVTLSDASYSELQSLATVLPPSAEPFCDGPAFSDRDRADTSVPLAPR
jgi:RNA polymerase subunit RPABC4/transcription elongation factor Spt4